MSSPKVHALLIGTMPTQGRLVGEALGTATRGAIEVTHTSRLADGLALLSHGSFDVVLLDCPLVDASPADALGRTVLAARGMGVVLLARPADAADLEAAIGAGAHALVIKDPMWELDAQKLTGAIDIALQARRSTGTVIARSIRRVRGKVITVLGACGGCGTSSTALRIARALAARGRRTVLADLRGWPGALATLACAAPAGHLGQLLDGGPDAMDLSHVEAALTMLGPRLSLLAAPPAGRTERVLAADQVARLLEALANVAEWVVVDLPCEVSPALEVACLASVLVSLVVPPTPAGARQGRRVVELLSSWSVSPDHVAALVVSDPEHAIEPERLHFTLGCEVLGITQVRSAAIAGGTLDPGDEDVAIAPVLRALSERTDAAPAPRSASYP